MLKVGEIGEIWRYPVKGMAGESLQAGKLGNVGIVGDRIWAVRDAQRKEIQSCKFRPELLLCSARCRAGAADQIDVIFPDDAVLGGDDPAAHDRISRLIGHSSTLEPLRPLSDLEFYRRYRPNVVTVLRTVVKEADQNVGVYGNTTIAGDLRVGDPVYIQ